MIVGIVTTIVGIFLLIFSIMVLRYPGWALCVKYIRNFRDISKKYLCRIAGDISEEIALFSKVFRTHTGLR